MSLDDCEATDRPVHGVDAVRSGMFQAVSALVGEPLDFLRLPRRMRAAGRLLKLTSLWPDLAEALALDQIDLETRWAAVDSLHSLARSHLDARLPEVGAALAPRLERALIPARRGSEALNAVGDVSGAAWTAISAAAELDGVVEAASPGWRERDDYARRSVEVYGRPSVAALRRRLRRAAGSAELRRGASGSPREAGTEAYGRTT